MTAPAPDPDPRPPSHPLGPPPAGVRGVARSTVDVAATPERVFRALTDPADLAAWWGGDAGRDGRRTHAWGADDPRPGGRWRIRTTDAAGRESTVEGEYRVVDPPHTIETTWRTDGDEAPSTVRYDLAPVDVGGAPGTRVTVTHTGPRADLEAGPQTRACAQSRAAVRPAWHGRAPAPAWATRPSRTPPGRRAAARQRAVA